MLPLYNLNMNSSLIINIQILQLFSCLKCTRQQILSTLRRQRSLATVLPIGTERVSAWVCLSIIMGCREREKERERKSKRGCLSLLIMQHHSLCIDPAGWSCLHIVRIKIIFSLKKKSPNDSHSYVTNRQLWNDLLWAEYCLVSFHLYSLNMHQSCNSVV